MLSRFLRVFSCHLELFFFFLFSFYIFRSYLIETLLHGNKNIFLTECSHSISCHILVFRMVLHKLTVSVGNAVGIAAEGRVMFQAAISIHVQGFFFCFVLDKR